MTEFNHLADDTRGLLSLPAQQRAQHMLVDRFITHDRLAPVLAHIEFLRFAPTQTRAAGLVVFGKPGSGKTMLARAVLRRHPRLQATETSAGSRPAVSISMTGAREAKILYNRLLAALDCPDCSQYSGADRERLVLKLCRAAQVRLLVVDEIQDILTSTSRQQRIALDTIKFLMNELSLPILVLGTLEAKRAMEVDEHLNARFQYRELPLWQADGYLGKFLETLEPRLPLRERSCLSSPSLMKSIIKVTKGSLDNIVKTVCHAAAHAVEQGIERVTPELIAYSAYHPPLAAVRQIDGPVPLEAAA